MNEIGRMAFITRDYPSERLPDRYVFVQQFVHAVARQGVACTVIQPLAMHRAISRSRCPYRSAERLGNSEEVTVLRPRFLSLSARDGFARLGALNPSVLTLRAFAAAARRSLEQEAASPDVVYGHFLYLGGAAAVRVGRAMGIPAFPCVGEGEFWTVRKFGALRAQQHMSAASGFMANSSLLKRMLHEELNIAPDKIGVFPNGSDLDLFYPRRQAAARERFGLPQNRFLVACIGNFLNGKGPARVAQAIEGLDGVGGIFAGGGPDPPLGERVLFSNRIPHADIPEFLSAADVFVLPTLVEGCCNAIIEAMACGLPIISSRGEFNDDVLEESMSLRINPLDVSEIRASIVRLRDDKGLRRVMADAALKRSRRFDINERARRVLAFMQQRIEALSGKARCGL